MSKLWYTVGPPWGDGSWVVEGSADPHVGKFIADCESMAGSADEDDYYGGAGDPAANAALIVAEHNAGLAAAGEQVLALKALLEERSLEHSRLMAAWQDTARALLQYTKQYQQYPLTAGVTKILQEMRDFDAAPEDEVTR